MGFRLIIYCVDDSIHEFAEVKSDLEHIRQFELRSYDEFTQSMVPYEVISWYENDLSSAINYAFELVIKQKGFQNIIGHEWIKAGSST